MEMRSQLHASSTSQLQIIIKQEVPCVPVSVWTLWKRKKSHAVSQIEPHFLGRPAHDFVTALTAPSQLRHIKHHCVIGVYSLHCNIITAATMGGGRVYGKFSRENGNLKRRT